MPAQFRQDIVTKRWVVMPSLDRSKSPDKYYRHDGREAKKEGCPFCEGNESMTPRQEPYREPPGDHHVPGWNIRVVENTYPTFEDMGELLDEVESLVGWERSSAAAFGAHEVIVETTDHCGTIGAMNMDTFDADDAQKAAAWDKQNLADCERIIRTYLNRFWVLERNANLNMISVFRNYGRDAGASQPHPHSQIMATSFVPLFVRHEIEEARRYFDTQRSCVFCDMRRRAFKGHDHTRVVHNKAFEVLEPFASRFPLETWIIPKRHESSFGNLGRGDLDEYAWSQLTVQEKAKRAEAEVRTLAEVLSDTLVRMHVVLGDFPYNYTVHTAPLDDRAASCYHWHIRILPRLTMPAGYEWATDVFVNPTLPEEAGRCLARVTPTDITQWRRERKLRNQELCG